jgi:hypothetical protein
MAKLAAAFIFGGILLVFGAVGGMEDPDKAHYFWQQLAMAVVGLSWMAVGVHILPKDE